MDKKKMRVWLVAFGEASRMMKPMKTFVNFSCEVLFIVLVALKLCGDRCGMPWWLVFAPIYGGFAANLLMDLAATAVIHRENEDKDY